MTSKAVIKFKKRLIEEIKNHPILYDVTNKQFSDRDAKYIAWQDIGEKLMMDVEMCKIMWSELRYSYQQYVRHLRRFFLYGTKYRKRRPSMAFETEMLFLWRFIADVPIHFAKSPAKDSSAPDERRESVTEVDRVSEEDVHSSPPDDINNFYKVIADKMKLINLIKDYRHVNDLFSRNYERISYIWVHISKKLKCKAMKCIKDWVYLRTLYEWKQNELKKNPGLVPTKCESNFLENLGFLQTCNSDISNSIYKQSLYLKKRWYSPYFQYGATVHLLKVIKDHYPGVIRTTEVYIKNKSFYRTQYHIQWSYIAKAIKSTPGQCEVSWLMLRQLYWEIEYLKSDNDVLKENWYFTNVITDLYQHVYKTAWPALRNAMIPVAKFTETTKITKYFPSSPMKEQSIVEPPTKKLKLQPSTSKTNKYLVIPTSHSTKILGIKEIIPVINLIDDDDDDVDDSNKPPTPSSRNISTTVTRSSSISSSELPKPSSITNSSIDYVKSNVNPVVIPKQINLTNVVTPYDASASADAKICSTSRENLHFTINGARSNGMYTFTKETTINFVRDILSVPSIHMTNMPDNARFWKIISKRHRMPVPLCTLFWNYLQSSFNLTDIAPLNVLLEPCDPPIESWKISTLLFRDLKDTAASHGFDKHLNELPDIIKALRKHKFLWEAVDLKHKDWDAFEQHYPHIRALRHIWKYLRGMFFKYLLDIEKGHFNKWPTEWCKVLMEMQSLVREKYEPSLPFYFIVQNQIFLERKRCLKELNDLAQKS